MPVFRSPPRLADVDRTLRRRPDGQVVIAVRLTGRPFAAVQSDVIAGVVVANGLEGQDAGRFRRAAWAALEETVPVPDRKSGPGTIDLRDAVDVPGVDSADDHAGCRTATPRLGVA